MTSINSFLKRAKLKINRFGLISIFSTLLFFVSETSIWAQTVTPTPTPIPTESGARSVWDLKSRFRSVYTDAAEEATPNPNVEFRLRNLVGVRTGFDNFELRARLGHSGVLGELKSELGEGRNRFFIADSFIALKGFDDWDVRVGRNVAKVGSGLVFDPNDWSEVPTHFDGAWIRKKFENFGLSFLGAGGALYGGGPEKNWDIYEPIELQVLAFDGRFWSEWLKQFHFHLARVRRSEIPYFSNNSLFGNRLGLDLKWVHSSFDFWLSGASQNYDLGVNGQQLKSIGHMITGGVGYTFSGPNQIRIAAIYHEDSGDDIATPNVNENYDPLFWRSEQFAGHLDILGFGNLTYFEMCIEGGVPEVALYIGLCRYEFGRTSTTGRIYRDFSQPIFGSGELQYGSGGSHFGTANSEKKVGEEWDLMLVHNYNKQLAFTGGFGVFYPGEYLKRNSVGGRVETPNGSKFNLSANLSF